MFIARTRCELLYTAAFEEPFGAAATLRVARVEDLVPTGKLRVGVGQMLGDDALEQPARLRI